MRFQHVFSFIASGLLISGAATFAQAQPKPAKPAHQHKAFVAAAKEPAALLKGIKLTTDERKTVNAIEKKYTGLLADLKKAHLAADKTGTETDAQVTAKVQALVDQEKSELRAALTAAQQVSFDKNAAKVKPV